LRTFLLNEYHDNGGHQNWRRLFANLLKRFWLERMSFDCKNRDSNCVVCNFAKQRLHGSSSLTPMGVPEYPCEIIGMDLVTALPKSLKLQYTAIFIIECHLKKFAHFIPYHKEVIAEETAYLFLDNCYILHGVAKVIVSDIDPRFVGTFW
jgi:hypothetical protein